MSVAEILAELPKLTADELQIVLERTQELCHEPGFQPSPELLAAIDEARATPEDQYVPLEEAYRIIESWNSK